MALEEYRRKRDFKATPEPAGKVGRSKVPELSYVIQKHAATRLHYDFRLEMEGVLRSWAVPKGPSLDPEEKRLAVHVEDHPLDYGDFEGIIPKGQYGGGTVLLWDRGVWYPLDGDPVAAYKKGKLKLRLEGEKLHGSWMLVRMHGDRAGENKENWLLIKEKDETAVPGSGEAVVEDNPRSVTSGMTIEEIAANPDRVWQSNRAESAGGDGQNAFKEKLRQEAAQAAQKTTPKKAAAKKAAAKAAARPEVPGARKAAFPAPGNLEPQLATLVSEAPRGAEWVHEIKYDGYRALCQVRGGEARLITRNGKDWTDRFQPVASAAEAVLGDHEAVLDGEVVVLEANGTTSFQALQNALSEDRGDDLVYYAFDLLYLDGYDLRKAPLLDRKEALAGLLAGAAPEGPIRLSSHVEGRGEDFFQQACNFALEGIISKRGDLPYHGGRNKDWVKVKCLKRQEFVVAGFTDPEGSRTGFGALLLGVYEGKDLVYAGKVGTGFNEKLLTSLRRQLGKLERSESPFATTPRELAREAARGSTHWVKPELVAEVAFTEWTRDGILRHPAFQGLREDKKPAEIVRERAEPREAAEEDAGTPRSAKPSRRAATAARPAAAKTVAPKLEKPMAAKATQATKKTTPAASPKKATAANEVEIAGVRLSSPDKVLFPEQAVTKRDLATYYERIADWILPHLKDRPLTLVRCPEGQGKQCFYQKHVNEQFPASIKRVDVEEGGGSVPYGAVDSLPGLISLVQMGVLELHVWGAHRDKIEKPDYVVFDLDPDEGLAWERVVEGARLMREVLNHLGLQSFLKTTGGKGLHVVLPLTRRAGWDEVKAFTKAVSDMIVAAEPNKYTSKLSKARRQGRTFIDYLRNGRGATSISAYSTRAKPGAPVSTPLFWEELDTDVRANTYTVQNLPARLESLESDPWEGFFDVRQTITAAMKKAVGME
ncbi:MAG TPA: DNA ligase D [Thermoanaerobaculia bacterium]|nr:DNA ligase D [Thermoanaerobaculia bacterium]